MSYVYELPIDVQALKTFAFQFNLMFYLLNISQQVCFMCRTLILVIHSLMFICLFCHRHDDQLLAFVNNSTSNLWADLWMFHVRVSQCGHFGLFWNNFLKIPNSRTCSPFQSLSQHFLLHLLTPRWMLQLHHTRRTALLFFPTGFFDSLSRDSRATARDPREAETSVKLTQLSMLCCTIWLLCRIWLVEAFNEEKDGWKEMPSTWWPFVVIH